MPDWTKTADVVIIGGGIIGLSVAFHLSNQSQKKIILLEKDLIAQASTGLSVGGIRQQFSHPANILLSQETLRQFEHFQDMLGPRIDFHQVGYLFLTQDDITWEEFRLNVDMQRRYHVPVETLSPEEIKDRWPFLETSDLKGGTYCQQDGYSDPYGVATVLASASRKKGVKILEHTKVLALEVIKDCIRSVHTTKGTISTPIIINAAGPWGGEVAKMAGIGLPVQPYRRQVFVTKSSSGLTGSIPMIIDQDTLFYFRKEGPGFLMGMSDRDEPPSFNTQVDQDFLEKLIETALRLAPILSQAEILRGWGGLYAVTPDENPIIGEIAERKGFYCAIGFSGHGFQHGPAVGRFLSELILEGETEFDLSPFVYDRFAGFIAKAEKRAV